MFWRGFRRHRSTGEGADRGSLVPNICQDPIPSRAVSVSGVRFTVSDGPADYGSFWSRVESGAWEPETLALMDRILTPGSTFVDVGAWIGPTTLYAAAKGANVDAYECDPVALSLLKRNLKMNTELSRRIRVYKYAIGESEGILRMWSGQLGNSETSLFASHEREGAVAACSQSFLAKAHDALRIFRKKGYDRDESALIKIDTEGAEFGIVSRLAELIPGSRAIWYVSFHELNLNPATLPARPFRAFQMLRTLFAFSDLRWYEPTLAELDKAAVLEAILTGTWPPHRSLVFASRRL